MLGPIRYSDFVNYDVMDAVKALMLKAAERTHRSDLSVKPVPESRGGSVFLVRDGRRYRGLVLEQLGTKNKVAEVMRKLTGKSFFYNVAIDTAATFFNDSATAGLEAEAGVMFIAAGSEQWFKDAECVEDYAFGWQVAFEEELCAWGGGETGTLGDVVFPDTAVLAGAIMGSVDKEYVLLPTNIRAGDRIIVLASNGVHANGLSAIRRLAAEKKRMPEGYLKKMSDGRTFGETILDRTPLYGKAIRACQRKGMVISWAINISGHGWRKLMRALQPFRYVVERLPPPQPVFQLLQEKMEVDDREMLGTYNCGGGYALLVPPVYSDGVVATSNEVGIPAYDAGVVERASERSVHIVEKNITWSSKELDL